MAISIVKNDIPLLEFDPSPCAVIDPEHEALELKLPELCVFSFLGESVDEYAKESGAVRVGEFVSMTKNYPIYVTEYKGERVTLCQAPVGSAPAAQLLDWLIGYGVKRIISTGSCGCLEAFSEGEFLIPYKALRDEGTSYHYAPPSRFIELDRSVIAAIGQTLSENSLRYREVMTWTTDGFYRETREKVAYRRSEGCSVVEIECSALAACAKFRGVSWGMLLYTADSLANIEKYDARGFGDGSTKYALRLCLEAILKLR